MALLDRCIFLAASAGTGDFAVASAVQGYMTPAQAGGVNAVSYGYAAQSADLTQWEVGTGTYTASPPTLVRTTILFNSLGNTGRVNFTAAPQVLLTALASDFGATVNPANPTATAGPAAINGTASTFMRSDAAPAVQLGSNSQKGLLQADGTTTTASGGIISSIGGYTPAPGNLTFYVATTGSDVTGDGSSGNPWATPQHAVNIANTYNWLNLYVPTINIAGGTYTDNGLSMVVSMPAIRNAGLGAFPTFNFTGPVTFSVAATGGALCVQTAPNSTWQFQGSKLTCDCFGTALSLAGDLSLECDVDFQDTGTHNFQGANLCCINPQTTGQIACFQAKTWQVLCPKLFCFVLFNTLTVPNFINNVIFKLPVGGIDMSADGGAFFAGNQFGTFYLGNGCSFTGGAATGGGQYTLQGFSLLGMSPTLLAQIPGDPNLNVVTGAGCISDGGTNEKVFDVDPFYSYQQPSTGFSFTIGNKNNEIIFDPSGSLATGTVTMPVAPQDGQKITVRSNQIITALTVSANSGQSLGHGAPTTLTAGSGFSIIYNAGNTTWYFAT